MRIWVRDARAFLLVLLALVGLGLSSSASISQETFSVSGAGSSDTRTGKTDPLAPGLELEMVVGVGRAEYRETGSITPTLSDWDGSMLFFGAGLTVKGDRAPLYRLRPSFWVADEDVESWREQDQLLQLNQMSIYGFELVGDVGYSFVERPTDRVRGWAGLGFRQQEFERSEFDVTGQADLDFGVVDESVRLGFVRLALDGHVAVSEAVSLEGDIFVGLVFFNEANNSFLGVVEGEGGMLVGGRIALGWQVDDLNKLSLGIYGEVQDLDGDVSQGGGALVDGNIIERIIEWPDNELILAGLDLRWTYCF